MALLKADQIALDDALVGHCLTDLDWKCNLAFQVTADASRDSTCRKFWVLLMLQFDLRNSIIWTVTFSSSSVLVGNNSSKTKDARRKYNTDAIPKQKPPMPPMENKSGKEKTKDYRVETISEADLKEITPGVPDCPDYDSEDDSLGNQMSEDVEQLLDDDDDEHDDYKKAQDDDDEELMESDNDDDDFVVQSSTTHEQYVKESKGCKKRLQRDRGSREMRKSRYHMTIFLRWEEIKHDKNLVDTLDTLSMRDMEIDFNPSDIETNNPVPDPRMFNVPLGNDDSISRSFSMTISNPLFEFDDNFTLRVDNKIVDEEFEDLCSLDPPKSTPFIDESTLLITPLPDSKHTCLRDVERFDPFFSLT
ncbi:hypothetical protein Tco_0845078 [Tanacetum coccineum]